MKRLINYINKNVLIKVTSLQIASVVTRIIAGLLTSKAIAIFIGAEGLALIGNLRNLVSSLHSIAILGFYKGVVKYISDFKENLTELSKTISTVFYIGFVSTTVLSVLCYFNAEFINDFVFPSYNNYGYIIRIFAIVLPFYALNMFSFSIMNGFLKYKILIVINIIGQILSVSVALLLIYQEELRGALISVVIAESLIFLITLVGIVNRRSLVPLIKTKNVSLDVFKKMSSYSFMALFPTVVLPLITIVIRNHIIENIGYKDAGHWEAMTRISNYYLMLVTSLMALYILPRFSEIDSKEEFKKEVLSIYKSVMPKLALGLFIIYLLRSFIVAVVFSSEFEPVKDLFLWQLLGDLIKVLSLVIAYQLLAKKMFWHYILTEAFLVITIYFTSINFLNMFNDVQGAVLAHFVSYMLYFGIIVIIFRRSLFVTHKVKT
ncbi:O-antigen translocase [Seonamhaeicola aphaedonensis]|uniref:PST family polysaccharide transporter n=1 Tax=Seonamhaeicola aphaedonensis TaxID=1461338 RepID=A0A3D9HKW2_9FLAO|nr:O-antigen translocase [Seonamhaeicola aphaedonensis]RED50055.1 PST family polysaccharide transporter [Seonamhaeicola aphaedonensis]